MIDQSGFLPLGFLKAGGIQTGDHKGMRYRMLREKNEDDVLILAWVWREPFSFEATPAEETVRKEFPCTEEGRTEAIEWIRQQYEDRLDYWEAAPSLLSAFRSR